MSKPNVEITGCGTFSGIFNFFKKIAGLGPENINYTKTLNILNDFRKANNNKSYVRFNTIKTTIDTEDDEDPDELPYLDLINIIKDYKISRLIDMDIVGLEHPTEEMHNLFKILKKIQNASNDYNNIYNNSNNLTSEYDNIISAISGMATSLNGEWDISEETPIEISLTGTDIIDGTFLIDNNASCPKLNTYTISTRSFEPTITYWSPDPNNSLMCLSNEPVSGLTDCLNVGGIWEPEQSNEPEPRCDGAEPEPCCNEPEPCTNESIFEQGKCDISNLCLNTTCEPDSEPEPSDLCCQEGFGNMSSYEIFMKKIGFLLLISIIILFIYNERRSIKLLFR